MRQYRFLFVCGLHRSGTSLVFQSLREHPSVSGFSNTPSPEDEGQFLQTVYPPARDFGGPGRFGFDEAARMDETSALATADNARKLFSEWAPYWDLTKPVLLEKSPPNLLRTRFLQALFPNSYFLVIVRHPVAVSLATRKWSRTTLESLVEHWCVCHERFESDRPHLRNLSVLRYEDFVAAPQSSLEKVCEFAGLAPVAVTRDVSTRPNEEYFEKWRSLQSNDETRDEVAGIVEKFGERVKALGYELSAEEGDE